MEVAALIISIIALIIPFFEVLFALKMNKTNLKSDYFSTLYNEYLFSKIPNTREKIDTNMNGKLVGYEELQNTVINMLCDSAFFKYSDEEFYNELKTKCFGLEDYLLESANKIGINLAIVLVEIDNKLKEIYKQINKKYEKG